MKIGFVSTWGEVGAAYVTLNYIKALEEKHEVFVYARGIVKESSTNEPWSQYHVEYSASYANTNIKWRHFAKWIREKEIEILFFNEQVNIIPVIKLLLHFPDIKLGTYVDYYKKNTLSEFLLFDFLICNTQRHFSVFNEFHPQVFYVKWGVDVELFSRNPIRLVDKVVFFHSCGRSNRKGTKSLINAYINGKLYERSSLVIHSQFKLYLDFDPNLYNIKIIHETVSHPGLYHLGDVYVYPTNLEGLGLTMYEALVSGLPIIVPNNAPMNEITDSQNSKLIKIDKLFAREDAYYWPLCDVNEGSLIEAMKYYVEKSSALTKLKEEVRRDSITKYNWNDRFIEIQKIFLETKIQNRNNLELKRTLKLKKRLIYKEIGKNLLELSTNSFLHKVALYEIEK